LNVDGPERRERNRQQLALLSRWCATVAALPPLIIAAVALVVLSNVVVAILVAVVLYAALGAWVYLGLRRYGATLLADLAPEPAEGDDYARLHNLAEGLCLAHGLAKPELWVIQTDSRNVATIVTGERERDRESALIITSGLLGALSRVELEGVLAQQLSHVRDGDTALATFVAAVASIPLVGRMLARRAGGTLDPELETHGDLAAVAMTRYPPGLAGALEKLVDHPTTVTGVHPTGAHLWLADPLDASSRGSGRPVAATSERPDGSAAVPTADGREPFVPHPPLRDRIELLREL
jgi:heat shock protein HtpX